MGNYKFEYWQSEKDEKWYFHFKAPNGEVMAQSQGYTREQSCTDAIAMIQDQAQSADTCVRLSHEAVDPL